MLAPGEGHHRAAVGLGSRGIGDDVGIVLEGLVDHMALIGVHGLQGDIPAIFDHFGGNFIGQALEGFLPLGPVVLRVNVPQ